MQTAPELPPITDSEDLSKRTVTDLTSFEHAELHRYAKRHGRNVKSQLRVIIRDWIASEQAGDAEAAAATTRGVA